MPGLHLLKGTRHCWVVALLPGDGVVAGAVEKGRELKVVQDTELVQRMRVVGIKPVP